MKSWERTFSEDVEYWKEVCRLEMERKEIRDKINKKNLIGKVKVKRRNKNE